MPNMESLKTDGHYTMARKIFSKIKNWVENKVQTDVPANAVFTDYKSKVDLYMNSQYYNQTLSKLRFDSTDFEGSMSSVGGGWTGTVRLKHHVGIDVPANAVFTDTTYSDATTSASGLMSAEDKTLVSTGISDAYDNTSTYDVGDIVIYNGSLYICNTVITTAEDFDPSKWDATNLGDVIASIYSFESDAVTKSAGGQITGGGLSFTSEGMPQQTTGSGVAMTMDTFVNGGQLKWQNWDNVTVGKAKDSNKLGGAAADDAATNSTIAKRTSSGYIYAKYFNASNSNQATMTTSSSALYANSDGFIRKCTMANFRKALHIDGYQTGITFKAGTKTFTVSTAAKSIAIFTNAQINSLLGVTGSSNGNTVVFAVNGDYPAKNYYYTSPVYENGTWYVRNHNDTNFATGPYRVNYLVIRFA